MTPDELAELVHRVDERILATQQEVQQLLSTVRQNRLASEHQIAKAKELLDSSREWLKSCRV